MILISVTFRLKNFYVKLHKENIAFTSLKRRSLLYKISLLNRIFSTFTCIYLVRFQFLANIKMPKNQTQITGNFLVFRGKSQIPPHLMDTTWSVDWCFVFHKVLETVWIFGSELKHLNSPLAFGCLWNFVWQ